MTLYIDGDCSFEGEVSASGVVFSSGSIDLQNSHWLIEGDFQALEGCDFVSNAFADSSWTITGDFSATGSEGNLLNLESDSGWILSVAGSGSASYVQVSNSDASGGSTIEATDGTSVDLGGNSNWSFRSILIEEALVYYLTNHEELAGHKIFPILVPSRHFKKPVITFNRLASTIETDLTESIDLAEPSFNLHVWGYKHDDVLRTGNRLRKALHGFAGLWNTKRIYDCEVVANRPGTIRTPADWEHNKLYQWSITIDVIHREEIPTHTTEIELEDSEFIEEALVGYLRSIPALEGFKVRPQMLQARDKYPAIEFERLNYYHEQDLQEPIELAEPEFDIHIYSRDYWELCTISHEVWKAINGFTGTWGEIPIHISTLEDMGDAPTESVEDDEHQFFYHRIVNIQIIHSEEN